MLLYGAASAALAWLVKPILDQVLPRARVAGLRRRPRSSSPTSSRASARSSPATGWTTSATASSATLRTELFEHILGQSAAFFARRSTGQLLSRVNNDVGQVQRAVSETVGDLARETLTVVGYAALLFYIDGGLALVCLTAAPLVVYPLARLGKRLRTVSRRSQEALERLSHVAGEAFTGHRIVKAFLAEGREAAKFRAAVRPALSHQHERHRRAVGAAAADGGARRRRHRRRALVRQRRDRRRPPDARRVHLVRRGAAADVRAGQEADAASTPTCSRRSPPPSASSSCSTPTPRWSSSPARSRCRRSPQAVEFRDVIVRLRGRPRQAGAERRVVHRAGRPASWPSSAAAAPARPRSSTCCRASTTSRRAPC